jgi:hypothetical protein
MAYNPLIMEPPEDPNALWCHSCGEYVDPDGDNDSGPVYFNHGVVVHNDAECLAEYAHYLDQKLYMMEQKIEKMVERGMS